MNAVVEIPRSGLTSQQSGRMAVAEIIQHVSTVQEVMRSVMKPEVHYGKIPGTDKPTLFKAGAEVLCMVFRIADSYAIEDLSTADMVRYRVTCVGTHQTSGIVLGSGLGEASSSEDKYKWRKAASDKEFEATPPAMRRIKYGKSWEAKQVRTEPADLANTVLKMANKRAKMAMTLNVTAASDCFSQDLDDMDAALRDHLARHDDDGAATPAASTAPVKFYPETDFEANLPQWVKIMAGGKVDAEGVINKVNSVPANKHQQLSEDQKARIRATQPGAAPAAAQAAAPVMTEADVQRQMDDAKDLDSLNEAAALIDAIPDAAARERLGTHFDVRNAELS